MTFPELDRITFDPVVMGGKPCIRGMRVTVGMILGLIASGQKGRKSFAFIPVLKRRIFPPLWPMRPGVQKSGN